MRGDLKASRGSPKVEQAFATVLDLTLDEIRRCPELDVRASILTGSIARGEGTMLERGGKMVSLSDVEMLLVVPGRKGHRRRLLRKATVEERIRTRLQGEKISCAVELTLALPHYFTRAAPCIFAYELKEFGKVMAGDRSHLDALPAWSASDIPRLDAFNLLSNRMVEQLVNYRSLESGWSEDFSYGITKNYLDIATSLLVMGGRYVSTYGKRSEALRSVARPEGISADQWADLLHQVDVHTKLKLVSPHVIGEPMDSRSMEERWNELAAHVERVWKWELRTLFEAPGQMGVTAEERFRHVPRREALFDWLRIAYISLQQGKGGDLFRARPFRGKPRHLLYLACAEMYFALAAGRMEPEKVRTLSPFRLPGEGSARLLIDDLAGFWTRYLRNN